MKVLWLPDIKLLMHDWFPLLQVQTVWPNSFIQRLKTQGLQKDRRKNKLKKINTMYEYKYILKLSLSAIFVFSFRQLSLFQDREDQHKFVKSVF